MTEFVDDIDLLANALCAQHLRDEAAHGLRASRAKLAKLPPNAGLRRTARQSLLGWARRVQEEHPSQAMVRLADRVARLSRIARAPLPWERDPSWRNPHSTEYYSACGYEDGIVADRENARDEARWTARKLAAMRRSGMTRIHHAASDGAERHAE